MTLTPLSDLEQRYGLPAGLLAAIERAESGGNPRAVSPKGAQGRFQFMPATAKELGVDPFDPEQSADGAGRYLRQLLDRYDGDVASAVAAYNWGLGNVDRQGLGAAPAETRAYLAKVLGALAQEAPAQPPVQRYGEPVTPQTAPEALPTDLPAVAGQTKLQRMAGGEPSVPGSPDTQAFMEFMGEMLGNPTKALTNVAKFAEGGRVDRRLAQNRRGIDSLLDSVAGFLGMEALDGKLGSVADLGRGYMAGGVRNARGWHELGELVGGAGPQDLTGEGFSAAPEPTKLGRLGSNLGTLLNDPLNALLLPKPVTSLAGVVGRGLKRGVQRSADELATFGAAGLGAGLVAPAAGAPPVQVPTGVMAPEGPGRARPPAFAAPRDAEVPISLLADDQSPLNRLASQRETQALSGVADRLMAEQGIPKHLKPEVLRRLADLMK